MKSYEVKTGLEQMDLGKIIPWLQGTYWACTRSTETIQKSLEHSLCFGVFEKESGVQVAFARVITDYATAYYLCDVVVEERLRGQGIGSILLRAIREDERLKPMRGILATRDAQTFYRHFGYVSGGDMFMQTPVPF